MRLAVLTSGGDAQGMNSAVRAVVRTALNLGSSRAATASVPSGGTTSAGSSAAAAR